MKRNGRVTTVLAFTLITLVVTLVHLDRFHRDSDDVLTRTAVWAWLIVYAVASPALVVLLVMQMRAPGGDPPLVAPLTAWLWPIIGLQAAALLAVGAMLLVAPGFAASLWSWQLTPLTARALAPGWSDWGLQRFRCCARVT